MERFLNYSIPLLSGYISYKIWQSINSNFENQYFDPYYRQKKLIDYFVYFGGGLTFSFCGYFLGKKYLTSNKI